MFGGGLWNRRHLAALRRLKVERTWTVWNVTGDNFLYGFQGRAFGTPCAGRARAWGIELGTRSAGEECVTEASVTTWSSAGNGGGRFAPGASAKPRPLARGR